MKKDIVRVLTLAFKLPKLVLLCLLFISVILAGCSNADNGVENTNDTNLTVEVTKDRIADIFAQMKALGDMEGKIVTINMADIKLKDAVSKMRVSNMSKKALIFNRGNDDLFRSPGDDYVVTCTWGDGSDDVVTNCGEDVGCAGVATWDCINNGGCATLCNNRLMYVPREYKSRATKIDQLTGIMRAVERQSKDSDGASFSVGINFDGKNFSLGSVEPISKPLGASSRNWQVDCFDSEGELLWSDVYDVRDDAGAAMIQCTNDGGCAGICTIETRYFGAGRE